MKSYVLTRKVYNMMVGRGYNLICKICRMALETGDEVESKSSKYRKWQCDKCGFTSKNKPKKKKRIGEVWYIECPVCQGIVYSVGRKFYHKRCYNDSHIDV